MKNVKYVLVALALMSMLVVGCQPIAGEIGIWWGDERQVQKDVSIGDVVITPSCRVAVRENFIVLENRLSQDATIAKTEDLGLDPSTSVRSVNLNAEQGECTMLWYGEDAVVRLP